MAIVIGGVLERGLRPELAWRYDEMGWLISLLFAVLVFYTDDYVVAGVLPEIARDLAVSEGTAGQLITTKRALELCPDLIEQRVICTYIGLLFTHRWASSKPRQLGGWDRVVRLTETDAQGTPAGTPPFWVETLPIMPREVHSTEPPRPFENPSST